MFGSAALELAIGLLFIFLLVSLLVTAATELLASWLRWRASNLWKSLRGMLGGPAQEQLYSHPLIKTLTTPVTGPPVGLAWLFRLPGVRRLWPTGKGPSYIPSRTFALALLDLMDRPYQAVDRLIAAIDAAAADPARVRQVVALAKSLPDAQPVAASLSHLQPLVDELGESGLTPERLRSVLLRLRREAAALSEHPALFDADVQGALRPLLAAAAGDTERMHTEIETWFNDAMDRASGWYKRKTQAVQVVTGLVLAIALDVDVILIARVLWADQTLRSALVAQAEAVAKEPATLSTLPADPEKHFEQLRGQVLSLGLPLRGSCTSQPPAGDAPKTAPWWCEEVERSTKRFTIASIGSIAVPVGAMRWFGWLLTGVAASVGAPFWFDLLNKIMSIRGAGRSPDEARAGQGGGASNGKARHES